MYAVHAVHAVHVRCAVYVLYAVYAVNATLSPCSGDVPVSGVCQRRSIQLARHVVHVGCSARQNRSLVVAIALCPVHSSPSILCTRPPRPTPSLWLQHPISTATVGYRYQTLLHPHRPAPTARWHSQVVRLHHPLAHSAACDFPFAELPRLVWHAAGIVTSGTLSVHRGRKISRSDNTWYIQ